MLTLTSVVQMEETVAAKGRWQYPVEASLTIFWYHRLEIRNSYSPFSEAATVILCAVHFSVLSRFSFKYSQLRGIQQFLLGARAVPLLILLLGCSCSFIFLTF